MSDKYSEAGATAENLFDTVKSKMAIPFAVNFKLLADDKQKKAVKIVKVNDLTEHISKISVVLVFNNYYVEALDQDAAEILLTQEMDRLQFDMQSGKIKLGRPELSTSVGVIKKWGIDEVARANKLEELVAEQKGEEDMENAAKIAQANAAELHSSPPLVFED